MTVLFFLFFSMNQSFIWKHKPKDQRWALLNVNNIYGLQNTYTFLNIILQNPNRIFPGLSKVMSALPRVTKYKAKTTIPGGLSLGQMLGNVNPRDFFTYRGSLTTPLCEQVVTWMVFSQVLPVSYSSVSKFWKMRDSEGHRLINNFRTIQPRNGRPVFYRVGKDLSGAYLGKWLYYSWT